MTDIIKQEREKYVHLISSLEESKQYNIKLENDYKLLLNQNKELKFDKKHMAFQLS